MTATTEQLLAAIEAVRSYARHEWKCSGDGFLPKGLSCICGLRDVLSGIDAMLAGRVTGLNVARLLRQTGDLLPETAADVAASEPFIEKVPLPESLRDPAIVLARKVKLTLPGNHPERPESSA